MLQIYKQNRAVFQQERPMESVLDAATYPDAPDANRKISGTSEQRETLDASMAKLMKLKKDVTETILAGNGGEKMVQKMLNALGKDTGGIDGKLGTKSRKAISEVQAKAGLTPNGLIDGATAIALVKAFQQNEIDKGNFIGSSRSGGKIPDGIIGQATLAAINGARVPTTANDNEPMIVMAPKEVNAPSGTVNRIKRTPKNLIELMFGAKGKKTDALADIDVAISANDKKLLPLQADIIEAKISGKNLDTVYANTILKISGNLDSETNKILASLTKKDDKIVALDYISQAMWGSEKTVNVARGTADSKEYVRSRKTALDILAKQGFSSTLINAMKSKVSALQKEMKGNLPTDRREGFMYTVRSQGSLRTVEPVTHQELVGINGEYVWDIPQTKADMQRYVDYMSETQVTLLLKAWGIRDGVKGKTHEQRKARIKRFMDITEKKLDIKLVFAENCGNIGMIAIPTKVTARVWESDNNRSDNDGGLSDNYSGSATTTPGVTSVGQTPTGGTATGGSQTSVSEGTGGTDDF